jgi:hypothetical protein
VEQPYLFLINMVAVVVLVFGVYWPRYRRADIAVALLGTNVGVMAVATVLANSNVAAGLGLGLFGVLSIIRLRSAEIDQQEVVYYFAALAMGLLGGVTVDPAWISPTFIAIIVGTLFLGDHPKLFADYRQQVITLNEAFTDETELRARLESMLNADVKVMRVKKVDYVIGRTVVDVRFRLSQPAVGSNT